jgi:segregation and condensation protein B
VSTDWSIERARHDARRAIEALVMVAEEPLGANLMGQLLELAPTVVEELCRELADGYEAEGSGFQLVRVAGGWRYQTHPEQAPYVERFVLEGQTTKLSAAALETLAIVAYKQPLSRAQVASIRGVSVDGVMRTLQQRGYVAEYGRDDGPGQAILYGTTRLFLEQIGLNDLSELPPLGQFVPNADIVEQLEHYDLAAQASASVDRFLGAPGDDDDGDGRDGGRDELDELDDLDRRDAQLEGRGPDDRDPGGRRRSLDAELGVDDWSPLDGGRGDERG